MLILRITISGLNDPAILSIRQFVPFEFTQYIFYGFSIFNELAESKLGQFPPDIQFTT